MQNRQFQRFHIYRSQVDHLEIFVNTLPDARHNHFVIFDSQAHSYAAYPHAFGRYKWSDSQGKYIPISDFDNLGYHVPWYTFDWTRNLYREHRNPSRPYQLLINDPVFAQLPFIFGAADINWPHGEEEWNEYCRARLDYNRVNPLLPIPTPGSLVGTSQDPFVSHYPDFNWSGTQTKEDLKLWGIEEESEADNESSLGSIGEYWQDLYYCDPKELQNQLDDLPDLVRWNEELKDWQKIDSEVRPKLHPGIKLPIDYWVQPFNYNYNPTYYHVDVDKPTKERFLVLNREYQQTLIKPTRQKGQASSGRRD